MSDYELNDTVVDAAWQRAMQLIRDAGYDPDELIAQAAANLEEWKRDPGGHLVDDWTAPPAYPIPCLLDGLVDADWELEPDEREF